VSISRAPCQLSKRQLRSIVRRVLVRGRPYEDGSVVIGTSSRRSFLRGRPRASLRTFHGFTWNRSRGWEPVTLPVLKVPARSMSFALWMAPAEAYYSGRAMGRELSRRAFLEQDTGEFALIGAAE
jgi:hypothetical protein